MRGTTDAALLGADNWDACARGTQPTPSAVWSFRLFFYAALVMLLCFGGPITRAAAGCALVFGIFGDRDGAVRHTLRLVGFALAIWLAPGAAGPLGDRLAPLFSVPLLVGRIIAGVLVGVGIMFVVGLFGRRLARRLRRHGTLKGADHVLGALLGSAEGVLVVATVCWMVATFGEPLALLRDRLSAEGRPVSGAVWNKLDSVRAAVRDDPTGRVLTRFNPLPEVPAIKTMQQVAEVAADAEAFDAALQAPQVHEFSRLPVVRKHVDAFRNDAALSTALNQGDVGTLVQSDAFAEMLNDRELYETVLARWDQLKSAFSGMNADTLKQPGAQAAFLARVEAARQEAERLARQIQTSRRNVRPAAGEP